MRMNQGLNQYPGPSISSLNPFWGYGGNNVNSSNTRTGKLGFFNNNVAHIDSTLSTNRTTNELNNMEEEFYYSLGRL